MDRKKELKEQYRQMKPEMGPFAIRLKNGGKFYIKAARDLRGVMNGALARLRIGMHPNRELQKEWTAQGPDAFVVEVLEKLPYGKEESGNNDKCELWN